jgi:methyl acetate hydrolase
MAHANLTDPDRPHRFREPDRMSETQHYGGAGLRGSPASFLKLLRALLRGGELDGTRILKAETVDSMYRNQMRPGSQQRSLEEYVRKNISFTSGNGYGLGGALDGPRLACEGVGDELTWSGVAVSSGTVQLHRRASFPDGTTKTKTDVCC